MPDDTLPLPDKMIRVHALEDRQFDDDGNLTFSFSSEYPVERWFGTEILEHTADAINFERMNKPGTAPALKDHQNSIDSMVGTVVRGWLDGDKARCQVRFAEEDETAARVKKLIEADILRNISVGYDIDEMNRIERKGEEPEFRAVRWTPYEVSFVAVPADPTVGIGREQPAAELLTRAAKIVDLPTDRSSKMPSEDDKDQGTRGKVGDDVAAENARKAEQDRIAEIAAFGKRFTVDKDGIDGSALANEVIAESGTIDDLRDKVIEAQGKVRAKLEKENKEREEAEKRAAEQSRLSSVGFISGRDRDEFKDFSLTRLCRALDPNNNETKYDGAERNLTVVNEKNGAVRIPQDLWNAVGSRNVGHAQARALNTTGATTGATFVYDDHRGDMWIGPLTNRPVIEALGARVLTDLDGQVSIPRQTDDPTTAWLAEGAAHTVDDPALGEITLTPKEVMGATIFSRQLLLTSSPSIDGLLRDSLSRAVNLAIDKAGLVGTGQNNQPSGITSVSGIENAMGTNGDDMTYGIMGEWLGQVLGANAYMGSLGWATTGQAYGKWCTTPKVSGDGAAGFLIDKDMGMFGSAIMHPIYPTQQLPSNGTKGTGSDLSAAVFGNFDDLIVGYWGGVEVMVNPYTLQLNRQVQISATVLVDIALRHNESFVWATDITV